MFRNKSSSYFNFSQDFGETFTKLVLELKDYRNQTNNKIDIFFKWENEKNWFSMILFFFYIIIIMIVLFLIFKKLKDPVVFISNVVFLTIPLLIVISGFICIYFLIYTDFCHSIYSAIYNDDFPVHNKGIGQIVSCFNSVYIFLFLINCCK